MHVREVVTQGGSTDLLHFSSVEIWILSLSGNLTHNEDIVLMPLKNKNIYISPSLCVVIPLPTHYTTFDNRHHVMLHSQKCQQLEGLGSQIFLE